METQRVWLLNKSHFSGNLDSKRMLQWLWYLATTQVNWSDQYLVAEYANLALQLIKRYRRIWSPRIDQKLQRTLILLNKVAESDKYFWVIIHTPQWYLRLKIKLFITIHLCLNSLRAYSNQEKQQHKWDKTLWLRLNNLKLCKLKKLPLLKVRKKNFKFLR